LSTQIAVVSPEGSKNVILYSAAGRRLQKGLSVEGHIGSSQDVLNERMTLEEIVEKAMGIEDGDTPIDRKKGKTRVIMVIHNSVAEWSMLKDRDAEDIVKHLTTIRKSPVTGVHPIKIHNRRTGAVDLEIFDTRLLAPAGLQSLDKLSDLLGKDDKKIDISEFYKRNMDRLLIDDPELFEQYALRDTEVTAKLFFLLQRLLNELAFGEGFDRPFKTLGSAAVKGFLHANPWFEEYLKTLNAEAFTEVQPIIKRAYLGGLNMANFKGDSATCPQLKDYCFVDIDFANAYANGNARCPKIDVDKKPEIVRAQYAWSGDTEAKLKAENLSDGLIRKVRQKVEQGRDAVEQLLRLLRVVKRPEWTEDKGERLTRKEIYSNKAKRKRRWAKIIREQLIVPDNTLLDRWVEQVNSESFNYEIPGFACVRFEENPDVQFTALPIKKPPFGLIYVHKGETVVPAAELVLAVNSGARVEVMWSVELPVERDRVGNAKLVFFDHLKRLVNLRAVSKAKAENSPVDAAKEQLLKEMINAFYGKSAQGLNYRKVYNLSTGENFALAPSELTEASVAALVTAQVRAALASILIAIEKYNRERPGERPVVVISATTDGLLIGFPCELGFSVVDDYFNSPKKAGLPPKLKKNIDVRAFMRRFGHGDLLDLFYQYAPIKNLRAMRIALTGQDDFLEIKHLADRVVCVKTRGQIGYVKYGGKEFCTLLARYSHKVPQSVINEDPQVYEAIMKGDRNTADAEWLLDRIEHAITCDEIERYPFLNLTSFKAILESELGLDLINWVQERKSNNDWDYKRKPILEKAEGQSFFSAPYPTLEAMLRERRQADAIRKSGLNATPFLVRQRLMNRGSGVRVRSGDMATLTRQFLRGYTQGHFEVGPDATEAAIAERVTHIWNDGGYRPEKVWKRSDISNARRANWSPNGLIQKQAHGVLLQLLCEEFSVDQTLAADLIFAKGVVERSTVALAQEAAAAILAGPALGIEPFLSLQRRAALPGAAELQERLYCFLDGEPLCSSPVYPSPVQPEDRQLLRRIFVQAGLSAADAGLCVEALCPAAKIPWKSRKNKAEKQCLEHFVTALCQPDIHPQSVKRSDVLRALKRFGLSARQYGVARKKSLPAKPLEATAANRKQIEAMSTALKVEPIKFLHALLEAS